MEKAYCKKCYVDGKDDFEMEKVVDLAGQVITGFNEKGQVTGIRDIALYQCPNCESIVIK